MGFSHNVSIIIILGLERLVYCWIQFGVVRPLVRAHKWLLVGNYEPSRAAVTRSWLGAQISFQEKGNHCVHLLRCWPRPNDGIPRRTDRFDFKTVSCSLAGPRPGTVIAPCERGLPAYMSLSMWMWCVTWLSNVAVFPRVDFSAICLVGTNFTLTSN